MEEQKETWCIRNTEELFGMSAEQFDIYVRFNYNIVNNVNNEKLKTEKHGNLIRIIDKNF